MSFTHRYNTYLSGNPATVSRIYSCDECNVLTNQPSEHRCGDPFHKSRSRNYVNVPQTAAPIPNPNDLWKTRQDEEEALREFKKAAHYYAAWHDSTNFHITKDLALQRLKNAALAYAKHSPPLLHEKYS